MFEPNLLLLVSCCLGFMMVLACLELATRKLQTPTMITRRIAHLAAGGFAIIIWTNFPAGVFVGVILFFMLLITVSNIKKLLRSVHNVSRKTYGEIYLPIGILLTFFIAPRETNVFVPAMLIMSISDVSAGIISDIRNKGRATNTGSLGFFVSAFLILVGFNVGYAEATTIAFIVTVSERISPYGSDNAVVPIAAATLLSL